MNIALGVVTAAIAASLASVSLIIAAGLALPIFVRAAEKRTHSL